MIKPANSFYRRLSQILCTALVPRKNAKRKIIAKITLIIRADTWDTKRASEWHWIQIWVILWNRQKQLRFSEEIFQTFFQNFKIRNFWKIPVSSPKQNYLIPNGINTFSRERIISARMLDGAPARWPVPPNSICCEILLWSSPGN